MKNSNRVTPFLSICQFSAFMLNSPGNTFGPVIPIVFWLLGLALGLRSFVIGVTWMRGELENGSADSSPINDQIETHALLASAGVVLSVLSLSTVSGVWAIGITILQFLGVLFFSYKTNWLRAFYARDN